jgi:FkbM family methyltransferase
MGLYGQEPEVQLLARLVRHLERPILLDVGAERGEVAEALLGGGIEAAHVFEPDPSNLMALRERFAADPRLTVHPYAMGDADGVGELHLSVDSDGAPLSFGHSLIDASDTEAIKWRGSVPVELRSLESLIQTGEIPQDVGILKIDTEGNDLSVVRGMGPLEPDVTMVEHWSDLPQGLGACPWTPEEMVAEMRTRGYTHFVFLIHRDEFVTFKWDDGEVERGAMGNLVFLHDRILDRVLPDLLDVLAELSERAVAVGQRSARAATERLDVIDGLVRTAEERLALIEDLEAVAAARLSAIERLRALVDERATELEARAARIESLEAELEAVRSGTP